MFKEGQGVVVEGWWKGSDQPFKAKNLMVKHSEEYRAPDDGSSIDKNSIRESLFKGKT